MWETGAAAGIIHSEDEEEELELGDSKTPRKSRKLV